MKWAPPPAVGMSSNYLQLWRLWNLGRPNSSSLIKSEWQCNGDKPRKLIVPRGEEWLKCTVDLSRVRLLGCEWQRPSSMSFPRIFVFPCLRCIKIGGFRFFFRQILKLNNFTNWKKVSTLLNHEQPCGISTLNCFCGLWTLCCSCPIDTQQHKGHVLCARLKIETSAGHSRESV